MIMITLILIILQFICLSFVFNFFCDSNFVLIYDLIYNYAYYFFTGFSIIIKLIEPGSFFFDFIALFYTIVFFFINFFFYCFIFSLIFKLYFLKKGKEMDLISEIIFIKHEKISIDNETNLYSYLNYLEQELKMKLYLSSFNLSFQGILEYLSNLDKLFIIYFFKKQESSNRYFYSINNILKNYFSFFISVFIFLKIIRIFLISPFIVCFSICKHYYNSIFSVLRDYIKSVFLVRYITLCFLIIGLMFLVDFYTYINYSNLIFDESTDLYSVEWVMNFQYDISQPCPYFSFTKKFLHYFFIGSEYQDWIKNPVYPDWVKIFIKKFRLDGTVDRYVDRVFNSRDHLLDLPLYSQ